MSTLVHGPITARLNFGANHYFLAHLQVAAARRFAEGRGFFLTLSGQDDDGHDTSRSYWLHPSSALMFDYDVENDEGERPAPIEIDAEVVEALLTLMDRPLGVLWGFAPDEGRSVPLYDVMPTPSAGD